jgi:S1-C subfamily serine protease
MALALSGQEMARPWVGVYYTMITRQIATDLSLPVEEGALVDAGPNGAPAVFPGSPGEQAGLQAGDIITSLGGRRVEEGRDLATLLLPYRPDDVVALTVLRGGETLEVEVTLGTLPGER